MNNCDGCPLLVEVPTTVPYGEGTATRWTWECSRGLTPDDPKCEFVPDGDRHYTIRAGGFSEAELEAGDFYGDMAREGGW